MRRGRVARVYKQNAITPVYTRLRSNWPHRDTRGYSTALTDLRNCVTVLIWKLSRRAFSWLTARLLPC